MKKILDMWVIQYFVKASTVKGLIKVAITGLFHLELGKIHFVDIRCLTLFRNQCLIRARFGSRQTPKIFSPRAFFQ